MKRTLMFTSESVTEGHPDKLCDQISDAVVDHFLRQDAHARIRVECAVSSAILFIAARFHTSAKVDLPHVARKVIKRVGYDQDNFNSRTCSIMTAPQGFPPDKEAQFDENNLSEKDIDKISAQNQVTVFGFACDQTSALMPLPIWLARKISRKISDVRRDNVLPYLMPDGKVQVGVEYREGRPHRIHSATITVSQRTTKNPAMKRLQGDVRDAIFLPVFHNESIQPDKRTRLFINPNGVFLGGPSVHSGLTGRKNAVDTYGEYSRHSGDALSGKDPMRIDRIGAYAARYAAKNIVAAGLATQCEVTLSYSIGLTLPVSLQVNTAGTAKIPEQAIEDILNAHFDFRLGAILRGFQLRTLPSAYPEGFYQDLAAHGHVGRDDLEFPWEKTDKITAIRETAERLTATGKGKGNGRRSRGA